MSPPALTYSYSPKALVASYERMKATEQEMLERASSIDSHSSNAMDSVVDKSASSSNTPRLVVAATQITGAGLPDSDVSGYSFRAEQAIEKAVAAGANLILLPELWSGPYFCQSQEADCLQLADPIDDHPNTYNNTGGGKDGNAGSNTLINRMQLLARLHNVVLPVSIYERHHNVLYNSVVVIDADGTNLGTYRKSHIPDGTGYQEKFYFSPGDSGFKVFDTRVGRVGVAICWDQWFPEAARAMALQGADVILYPTAIGSEPQDPTINSVDHWQRVMQGHAAANMVPVVASNRVGTEILLDIDGATEKQRIDFYGRSFITDNTGAIVAECTEHPSNLPVQVLTAEIDKEANRRARAAWGIFRDRRPDLYKVLLTKDGSTPAI
jgi:N-carbamoylputrescine amidase